MPTLELPDGGLIYHEVRGDGPPLVLLNGMSQSTANWISQSRHLQERFTVIAYDARGQGRSDLGEGPLTLDGHVSDLVRLLATLDVDSATLCGFSHGARLALRFAARHPHRVRRLALTSIGDGDDAARDIIVRSWLESLRLGGVEAMAWCALPTILGRRFLAANAEHVDAMIRATLQRNSVEGLTALLDAMRAFPEPLSDARAVRCPTLLVTAPDDALVSAASADRLAAAIAGCTHRRIADSGHTVPIEAAEAWRAALLGFLDATSAAERAQGATS